MLKTAVDLSRTIFKNTCRILLIISAAFNLVFSAIVLTRSHTVHALLIMIPSVLLLILLYNPTAFPLADLIAGVSALLIGFFCFIFFVEHFSIITESSVDYNTGQFLAFVLPCLFLILNPFMAFKNRGVYYSSFNLFIVLSFPWVALYKCDSLWRRRSCLSYWHRAYNTAYCSGDKIPLIYEKVS